MGGPPRRASRQPGVRRAGVENCHPTRGTLNHADQYAGFLVICTGEP